MRNLCSFILLLSIVTSCSKKDKSSSTSNPTYPNTIKVTIDGKEYEVKGGKPSSSDPSYVGGYIYKFTTGRSGLDIANNGSNHPFTIWMQTNGDSPTGLGTFDLNYSGTFKEQFQGGMAYEIVDGTANVTTAEANRIVGTFEFELENKADSKTVTGSFDINQPYMP